MVMSAIQNSDDVIISMDETQARNLTNEIRGHLREARNQVLAFYRAKGWSAMGYESFKDWAIGEFEVSWQQVYNILNAAEVDENLTTLSPQGESYFIPLKHATALGKLDKPEDQYRAYGLAVQQAHAQGKDAPTETIVAQAVQSVQNETTVMESPYPVVRQMLAAGELSSSQAQKISLNLDSLKDEPAQVYVQSLMARYEMKDPELVVPLGHKHKTEIQRGKESYVLSEIDRTGALAGKHLSKATTHDLKRANQEAQNQHIAEEAERQRQIALMNGETLPEEFALTLWKNAPVKSAKRLIKELPLKDLEAVFLLLAQHLGFTQTETGATLLDGDMVGVQFMLHQAGSLETVKEGQNLQVMARVKPIEEKDDEGMNKTGKAFLSPEVIEVAGEWWTNSLRKLPNKNNADNGEMSDTTILMTLASVQDSLPSEEVLMGFKQALIEAIQSEEVWGEHLSLGTDYFPEGCLADAAEAAGVGNLSFSVKTRMHIYPNEVHLKAGYGSEWVTIWRKENL